METPIEKLKKMTAWNTEPALTLTELEEILSQSSLTDPEGLAPPYSLNTAAASVWLIKTGRASSLIEMDPPGSGIATSKVFDNCRAMARLYSAKRNATVLMR